MKSIKTTVAKTVIALELARNWTDTIVLVRPLAFGQPIEVEHELHCHEALIILGIVFTLASWTLYMLSKVDWQVKGLITTSAFMWAGGTFSPTATTCMELFPMHPLAATVGYALFGMSVSVVCLWLIEWLKERGVVVVAQSLSLVSTFIVISTAAVCNKEAGNFLPWTKDEYVETFLAQAKYLETHDSLEAYAAETPDLIGTEPLFNPALVALLWAVAVNMVLVRIVRILTADPKTGKVAAAIVLFCVKYLAFFTGFQYNGALKTFWTVILEDTGDPPESVLALRALTVFTFAACYITFGQPISGVPGLAKDRLLAIEEVDKAFHDTAVGQSIGMTFTPFLHKTFQMCTLAGGTFETWLYPPTDANHAEEMAYKQDFEVLGAVVYVVLIATPLSYWLYMNVVVQPNEAKSESQNAAAAADDGGGDDGGDDGGGD